MAGTIKTSSPTSPPFHPSTTVSSLLWLSWPCLLWIVRAFFLLPNFLACRIHQSRAFQHEVDFVSFLRKCRTGCRFYFFQRSLSSQNRSTALLLHCKHMKKHRSRNSISILSIQSLSLPPQPSGLSRLGGQAFWPSACKTQATQRKAHRHLQLWLQARSSSLCPHFSLRQLRFSVLVTSESHYSFSPTAV